ncbi:terminase small subunit [Candidatus Peregrinibacteria bacterium]|nr:terminase small subunit [Candidatus Peregrinibacteria bacterium]
MINRNAKKGLNKNNPDIVTRDVVRQKLFVKEFLIDFNARRAAIAAGYSQKTADKNSKQILGNIGIHNAIIKALEERVIKLEIKQEDVLNGLITIYRRSMQEVEVTDTFGRSTGIWEFDAKNALKALELLGKHLGMFSPGIKSNELVPTTASSEVVFYIPDNGRMTRVMDKMH